MCQTREKVTAIILDDYYSTIRSLGARISHAGEDEIDVSDSVSAKPKTNFSSGEFLNRVRALQSVREKRNREETMHQVYHGKKKRILLPK